MVNIDNQPKMLYYWHSMLKHNLFGVSLLIKSLCISRLLLALLLLFLAGSYVLVSPNSVYAVNYSFTASSVSIDGNHLHFVASSFSHTTTTFTQVGTCDDSSCAQINLNSTGYSQAFSDPITVDYTPEQSGAGQNNYLYLYDGTDLYISQNITTPTPTPTDTPTPTPTSTPTPTDTPTPTPTAYPSPINIGYTVHDSSHSLGTTTEWKLCTKMPTSTTGIIPSVSLHHGVVNASLGKVAIYTDSSGSPDQLVSNTVTSYTPVADTVNTITLANPYAFNGNFWVCVTSNTYIGSNILYASPNAGSSVGRNSADAWDTFPTTFNETTTYSHAFAIYATVADPSTIGYTSPDSSHSLGTTDYYKVCTNMPTSTLGTINSISLHHGVVNASLGKVAIYTDSSGSPDQLVSNTVTSYTPVADSWNTITLTNPYTFNGNFWVCVTSNTYIGSNILYASPNAGSSVGRNSADAWDTFPTTFNETTTWSHAFAIYATVASAPTPTPTPTLTATPTPTPTNYIPSGSGQSVTVEGVKLTGDVTSGGTVTVTPSSNNQGGPVPSKFKILNTFYEISSTAQFDFPIYLTFTYQVNNQNQNIDVLHYLASTATWETLNIITNDYDPDTQTRTIKVSTNSLSPFAIVEEDTTAPSITDFQLSPYVVQNGSSSTITVTANDDLTGVDNVTYTLTSSSGQETTGSLSFVSPANNWQGTVSPSTGVYAVKVTATDFASLHTTSDKTYLAVYDPSAGFVTGGGWLIPDDATRVGVSSGGKSNFGYEVKYINGTPQGNLLLNYKNDNLEFKSTSIEWLTVSGSSADFQGQATVNGSGTYTFRAHVVDGEPDQLDIRIWGSSASFDNPTYRLSNSLSGGNIKIHQ